MAWLTGWSNRKLVTIDTTYVDSDLTDFPVLIKFASDADIGAAALSSGNDIRFTSSDGTTLLKYEREAFAVSAGNASGTFWVKVPTVSGSVNTEIYLYYGNSGASDGADKNNVWDSNFAAVWHLEESGNGTASEFTDSTSNARHGRGGDGTAAAVPTRATGQVDYGQDFDNTGTADFIGSMGAVSSFSFIQNTGVFTVELLLNGSGSTTSEQGVIGSTPTGGDKGIYLSWNASNLKRCDFFIARGGAGSSVATATNSVSSGAWHHVAFTGDASTIRSYIDGAAGATGSIGGTTTGDSTRVLNAGRWNGSTPGGYYDGLVDEIRISTVQRSAAWLKFVYRNIFEVDNEISFGSQEADAVWPVRGLFGTGIFWGQGNDEGSWTPVGGVDENNQQGFGKSIGRN